MKPYYSNNDFALYQGDCNQVLQQISNKVDMIFADPPYFLSKLSIAHGIRKDAYKGEWDLARSLDDINAFNREWLSNCRDLLTEKGTIWVSGTYHNIFSVAVCMQELGYKILNVIVWHKNDVARLITDLRFNFEAEYIIWARKDEKVPHFFNYNLMRTINGGRSMPDVWSTPSVGLWEKKCGKHPTQKPLRLLYRMILSCTHEGDSILDPFAGSCTTGIAANLTGRKFIGIEKENEYLDLGIKRRIEIDDDVTAHKIYTKMSESPKEDTVLVNHAKKDTRLLMVEKGICYMRAGESKGSLQITPGFERMKYVLLHTNGDGAQLFKLDKVGTFQIWSSETLEEYGFHPEHSPYYIVVRFNNKPVEFKKRINLKQRINTYTSKIRPLSDFLGIK